MTQPSSAPLSAPWASRAGERRFWLAGALGALVLAAGLAAAHYMEVHGHAVTGMSNRIVWGVPHVFAIFMIVAASGVLNVASVGSVFGQPVYKARARLSGLLAVALLAGGLTVLMLDLGRPERIVVAATHYNLRSIFAWNVLLYSGLFAIVALYLWTLMERRLNAYSKYAGLAALVWRIVLTTGTGLIFGFLVARQAYQSAVLAPMFIAMSLAWGMAIFLIAQAALFAWQGRALDPAIRRRMARLLGVFVAAVLYFVLVYHLTNLYFARQVEFTRFILASGGAYPLLFWLGYVFVGSLVPLLLLFHPRSDDDRTVIVASTLVIVGAFAQLYVFIIGGQAFPLELFPGYAASSTFFDGAIAAYRPSLAEILLGFGGLALALVAAVVGVRVLPFMPEDDRRVVAAGSGAGE